MDIASQPSAPPYLWQLLAAHSPGCVFPTLTTCRIHRLARHDCLGCQSLMKLTQFLESKTRSRPKKAG